MATAAIHLALAQRVRIGLQRLRAFVLVAFEADLRLGCRRHYRIARCMTNVAIGAGDVIAVMATRMPGDTFVTGVTVHAQRILY